MILNKLAAPLPLRASLLSIIASIIYFIFQSELHGGQVWNVSSDLNSAHLSSEEIISQMIFTNQLMDVLGHSLMADSIWVHLMGVPLHACSDKIFEMLGALLRSICPVEGLIWFSSMASQNIESGDLTVLIGCSSSCAGCRYYVSVVDMDIVADWEFLSVSSS